MLKHASGYTIGTAYCFHSPAGVKAAAAEIAALQSRAFEDGARWMRERAADRVKDRAYLMEHGEEQAAVLRAASDLAALPLQPEGERNA